MKKRNILAVALLAIPLILFVSGCKKKAPPPPPPPPPPPAKPAPPPAKPVIGTFVAEPSSIERGQSATLRWSVTDATSISINEGIGSVEATGSRRVFPNETTTYTLTATNAGGTTTADATVNVTAPPPPPPPPPPTKSFAERISSELQDAYFDFDKSNIRPDAQTALTSDANAIKAIFQDFPSGTIMVEGNCDDRGSAEYNLALGDRRAQSAKDFLVQLGVPADRLKTISYGKERLACTEHTEECWQKCRHVHFEASPQ